MNNRKPTAGQTSSKEGETMDPEILAQQLAKGVKALERTERALPPMAAT